jgi:hypothetical protein
MKASPDKLAHLVKICGFLVQTKVYLFWHAPHNKYANEYWKKTISVLRIDQHFLSLASTRQDYCSIQRTPET